MDFSNIWRLWEVIQVFPKYTIFQKIVLIVAIPCFLYIYYLVKKNKSKFWEILKMFPKYSVFIQIILVISILVISYTSYLVTIGRPLPIVYNMHFFMSMDRQIHSLPTGVKTFDIEFKLLNSTEPPEEINNLLGNLWVDGKYFMNSSIQPSKGGQGSDRVEWDIQTPVLPKESVFLPTKIKLELPDSNQEILVGAQLVSKQTSKQEYLWKIINDKGVPKLIMIKTPNEFR